MMGTFLPIFKQWIPEWFIKVTMFLVLLPGLILFFLPLANVNAASGHYGSEPYDIQFSVVLFYAGYASFFSLERRFFTYLATKEYFFVITFIQLIAAYVCFITHDIGILFIFRFVQGMAFTALVNLSLAIIYSRLHNERAREIGFSIFFGMLICMIPFNNLITADLVDSFDFNTIYKFAMFCYIPGLLLLHISMNNIRLNIKFPLYQLDWPSFVLYAVFLTLVGYICVYGQEYYWLDDNRILYSVAAIVLLLVVYVIRQLYLKRPYFNLQVFKYRNFVLGCFLLFIMYICRFASGIGNNYYATVLGLDPIHISYLTSFNIVGLVLGVIISCVMVLQRKPARMIWLCGFVILLVYHVWMFFLCNIQANESEFYIPLLLQGLGIGSLMTPTIVYIISAVPVRLGPTAAGIGLLVRCFGFFFSIALINYFELYEKSRHFNAFQDHLVKNSPAVNSHLLKSTTNLIHRGVDVDRAAKISHKLLIKSIDVQSQMRFLMDYFEMISYILLLTIMIIALFPFINRTVNYLRSSELPPF